jgi:hypothetical protein
MTYDIRRASALCASGVFMSLYSSFVQFFSCRFGLTRPEPGNQVIKEETEHQKKWDVDFIHTYKDYLDNDYKNFVEKDYPDYVEAYKHAPIKQHVFPAANRPLYSLALSGGGIRSAAFGTGVIQALHNPDLSVNPLNKKDKFTTPTIFSKLIYLSTVSGGGYAGAALSWGMKKWATYPFGDIKSFCGSKGEKPEDTSIDFVGCYTDKIAAIFKQDKKVGSETLPKIPSNKMLSYIRLHGKYLSPPELPTASLIGSVINSVFHSFITYTFLLSAFIFLLIYIANTVSPQDFNQPSGYFPKFYEDAVNSVKSIFQAEPVNARNLSRIGFTLLFLELTLVGLVCFLITSIFYGASSYFTTIFSDSYKYRIRIQKILGLLVKFIFFSALLAAIPLQIEFFRDFIKTTLLGPGGVGAGLTALLMSINEFRKQLQSTTKTESHYGNILRNAIVIIFIYVLLTISYLVAETGYLYRNETYLIIILVCALIICFAVNINNISPHRMYRDRLMDTFLADPHKDTYASLAEKGYTANQYRLSELDEGDHWAPYHLINTNIILNNSPNSQHNSRLGDNFILSPKFCGSDATGYVPTKDFAFGTMTLATATSISGAAANPHSGVGGIGDSTTPLVSFLMTFFGLRLGYWANNPKHILSRFKFFFKPNYFIPGTFSLLNYGHTEDSAYIELSDGGHFDNTGIYELIRRRIPWIILSDGSADIKATFEDLGNALSRIRIDFGVAIRFNEPGLDLCGLIPGSQAESTFDKKFNLSKRGYAIGDIIYPATADSPRFIGTFVYIKATMTPDLPGDIYAYQADHPEFPNEPTSDQFFNERQFESYRELGYQLTKQLLQDGAAMKRLP